MKEETPDDLHELQYARHILEEVLGWPSKGNLEMVGDCLRSLMKAKRLTGKKAHGYMVRAIKLAQDEGRIIDHFFFSNGIYTQIRPPAKEPVMRPVCPQCAATNGFVFVDKYTVRLCNHEQLNG